MTTTNSTIQLLNPSAQRGNFHSAVFDFDGTLSLIREGWQAIMLPYFVEVLQACPNAEGKEEIERVVVDFVDKLTGKQTIYQCFQLQEEVKARGGDPLEALEYKHEYLRRLQERIQHRLDGLAAGEIDPDSLLLLGSRDFLQALKDRGVTLYLASGTDLPYVLAEAKALKVDHFFGEHIYAALDEYKNFSKQMIIDKILRDNDLHGPELLAVGDGYVEIQNAKGVGGFALGVASDEDCPGGIDDWKVSRLTEANADAIVRDFEPVEELMAFLFPE